MKIGIIGGGAVGLATAHYLNKSQLVDVTILCRTEQQANSINENGLWFSDNPDIAKETAIDELDDSHANSWQVTKDILATVSIDDLADCEIVFVTVKQFHIPSIVGYFKNFQFNTASNNSCDLVFVCNGLGAGDYFLQLFSNASSAVDEIKSRNINLCSGYVMVASTRLNLNKVNDISVSKLFCYGPLKGFSQPKFRDSKLGEMNFQYAMSNLEAEYEKAQYSILHNANAAMLNMTNKQLYQTSYTNNLMSLMHKEIDKVVKALNLDLQISSMDENFDKFTRIEFYPSTWHDYQLNQPTEVAYINGMFVKQAQKLGIETPNNQMVAKIFEVYEEKLNK